jgi:hypothetical protein
MSVFSRKQLFTALLEYSVYEHSGSWAYTDSKHWIRAGFATRAEAQVALLEHVIEQNLLEEELHFQALRLERDAVLC